MDAQRAHQEQFDGALVLDGWSPLARGAANFLTPSQSNPHGGNLDNFAAVLSFKSARTMQARTGVRRSELTSGVRDRGAALGQRQGREFRTDTLQALEFDQNAPRHVRGWLTNERRRLEFGASHIATPPGYEMSHGRGTPAREGFDYSNSRLQGSDLNRLEERIRRQKGRY